jgi:predicted MFS family arabinose efflux permease
MIRSGRRLRIIQNQQHSHAAGKQGGTMSTSKSWDTRYEFWAVLAMSVAFGLVGLDRFILMPLLPSIGKDLGLNYTQSNLLVSALAVAWGFAAIFAGNLSDHLGRRAVLVPSVVLFSLFSVFSGMAGGFVALLLIRGLMGISEGAVASTGVAVTVEASHPKRRGMNNGFFQCSISFFGLAVAPILATQLLEVTTWRNVFYIVGVPGLLVAVFLWKIVREPAAAPTAASHATQAPRAPFWSMFKHRNIPLAMLALLCAMCGIFVISAMMSNYLVGYLKLPNTEMGFVSSAIGFGGVLGQLGVLTVSDYIGRRWATLISFVVAAIALYFFIQTGADQPSMLFVTLFFASLFNFGALAILAGPIPAEAAPPGLVASAAGLVIGAGEIFGGGVAPGIAGWLADTYSLKHALYLALAGQVVGIVFALFLHETAPRRAGTAAHGEVSELDRLAEPR